MTNRIIAIKEKLDIIKMNWEQLHMNVEDGDMLINEAEEMLLIKEFLSTLRNSNEKIGKLYIGDYVYNIQYDCFKDDLN